MANWRRLLDDPDYRGVFECERVAAEVRRRRAVLLESDESDPAILGRARGFLEAVELLQRLPEKMLSYQHSGRPEGPPADYSRKPSPLDGPVS